jgi:AraC-like DNA-binding protein
VGVAVEVEQRAEALHERDGTAVRVGDSVGPCASPLPGKQLAQEPNACECCRSAGRSSAASTVRAIAIGAATGLRRRRLPATRWRARSRVPRPHAELHNLPGDRGVVPVSKLLRELILALEVDGPADRRTRLALVFADQVTLQHPAAPTIAPLRAPRLDPIEDALRHDPSDPRTLEAWAAELGVALRTLARAFWRAARMTFTDYRNQVRLHAALERLARGEPVTTIAHDLGFHSASSFIAMFKRATGVTPKAYWGVPAPAVHVPIQ